MCSEEGIGRYLMCSLFSPVFEFADQQTAVATAEAVMAGLMAEENRDETSMREHEIERIWQGETVPEEPSVEKPLAESTLEKRLEQSISRRDLLRGRFPTEP